MQCGMKKRGTIIGVVLIILFGWNSLANAGNALLSWDPNKEASLAGYKVYYGTAVGSYGAPVDVGNQTSYTVTGLGTQTYYFAVTAYDTSGNESGFSTEVNKTFTDTTPPVLSAIGSGSLTSSGAVITWTTNETSTTQVEYGTTTGYGALSPLNSTLSTSHSRTLSGLTASTLYHYRVISKDAAGNVATSGDNTFTTAAAPDTSPPAISAIASSAITSASATVSWTTNEAADTQIQFGVTTSYGSSTTLNTAMTTSHSQGLSGLSASTTYHFRVVSKDAANNTATSGDNTFTTPAPPDTSAPTLSGIAAGNLTASSATITWNTNENSTSQVEYGTTTSYGASSALDATLVTGHTRALSGLNPSTTYHFRVVSKDAANNTATSGDNTFTTPAPPDTTPPVLSGITAGNLASSAATISWTTNEPADSQVQYGTSTAYGSSTTRVSTLTTGHSQGLTGLVESTTYHFRVLSRDAAGNLSTSGDNTFITPAAPDTTPPALSTIASSAITPTSATISWTTNEAADTQIQYGTTTSYGASTTLNTSMTTSHSQGLSGLSASTTYHFRVVSKDAAGNAASSGDNTFTTLAPPDTTPPTLSGIGTNNLSATSVTITWNSNENATSQVEFGTTASYGASSALDSTLVTGHSRTLSGLNPSTTYHFRVVSKDAANNTATSADNTFTTTAPPDTSAPTLSAITAGSLTPTSAVISWSTGELSTSQVEFGPTTAYGALSTLDTTLVTSHTRPLNGLSASTTYHYRVISKDASNNAATSGDNIFTTPDLPDTTAPVLSGIAAGSLSNNSATISWTTNEPADTQVQFGTTSAYGSSTSLNSSLSTSHSQSLTGLSASTTYHFRVISKDAANNAATSGDNTFTTPAAPDTTPPTFSGIAAGSLSNSSAVIHWTTNEIADTQVQFGTTTAYGSITPLNSTLSISHSQGLTGLQPSTLYHYRVLSQDAAGNAATSGDNTFTTTAAPDTTVPVLSGITVGSLSNSAATISWTTNEAADSQVQFGTTAAYGASTARDGALTTGHSQNLTGLSASTTYHFRVLSSDAAGNLSTSGDNTFTTAALPDTTPPVLSGIAAGNLTATSAQISWSTNEVATSQVEYGATTAYGALSVLDTTLVTGHTRTLSSLNPSTTYHYRVISKDATNHTAFSGDNTFTTAAAPDSSGPVLALITASDLRANQVTISWGTDEPATTQIEYGETVAYGTLTTLNATLLNSHSQTVTNLQNNTTYHYRVRSADALGNLSVSSDQTFTTTSLIDTTPPADVQSFTALPGNNQVTLDWVNPSDSDFVGVHVVYRTDRFPTDLNDGTVLGDFSGQPGESVSTVHAGLETNTTYYYSASSYDRSGNYQHTAHASASLAGITPSVSSAQSSAGGGGGGGCTMVSPTEGQSRGPLDAAELFGLIGLIVIRMVRKGRMK